MALTLAPHLLHPNQLDEAGLQGFVQESLHDADDGELFLEYTQHQMLGFDDGRLKQASHTVQQGFGLRYVLDDAVAYAHSSNLNMQELKAAQETVRALRSGYSGSHGLANAPAASPHRLYGTVNPLEDIPTDTKIALLQEIDRYLRRKDNRVRQVSASIAQEWQVVAVIRPDGFMGEDIRPLVRLNISVVTEQNDRMEQGSQGAGGRYGFTRFLKPEGWQWMADEALRQSLVNQEAQPAPAGEMDVVLGPGWPGVLLHEAVGHGLEGDFNRKGTSVFSGRVGQQVAAKGVTVVDDGTMSERRGSLNMDDEGTPTGRTVLIEDGILKGYLQDRMNARLMGVPATGNGRRESYACQPMPRMTNTFMEAGDQPPEELISRIKRGIYAVQFGGGQVDITSGKFVFSATEAYWVEDGRLMYPVKGATLIGSGPEVMGRIVGIGNDLKLDHGVGTCGKGGQSVPVGVGQPSLLIEKLTVGGTQAA